MNKEDSIALFDRDIQKLKTELESYPTEESLWVRMPGTINSGGNLCQHLIGNLRTYVGLTLGRFDYVRDRDAEFQTRNFTRTELLAELDKLADIVAKSIAAIPEDQLAAEYPRGVLSMFPEQSIGKILQHLLAHLSYHTGQLNYHRRWVSIQKLILQNPVTAEQAKIFADEWIDAWNSHKLEDIMALYSADIEFYSPYIIKLGVNDEGIITDKAELAAYFQRGLDAYPDLFFDLHEVLVGNESVVIYYTSVSNRKSGELMQFDAEGKINLVRAHYN